MRYQRIYNLPRERSTVTYPYAWWDDGFTPDEITRITEHYSGLGVDGAKILGSQTAEEATAVRVSGIKFHRPTPETSWFFDRLNSIVATVNDRFYGMDLNGYESVQYTEYHAEVAGKYDWHMDACLGSEHLPADMIEPRKLSLSLLLDDDYEGGEFEVNLGNESEARAMEQRRGRILFFPSYVIHRVRPVTRGVRRSIVAWVTGPKFV